ncbi:MAG TPA: hypothetical protein VHC22_02510 [Pirellulales bacterium]|nr:hypothetical protein [Pirellulales bacterium]
MTKQCVRRLGGKRDLRRVARWVTTCVCATALIQQVGPALTAEPSDAAPPVAAADEITLRGRVLLPDGKPVPGADVYWVQVEPAQPPAQGKRWWEKRAVTDDEGRFQWTLADTDAKIGPANRPPIFACKAGLGLDGMNIGREEAKSELTLRLAEEVPIRGRLTDTEGRPVTGAKIVVLGVQTASDGSLDGLLEKWKRNPQSMQGRPERMLSMVFPFDRFAAESDREGRFTISGLGAERVVALSITAAGYAPEQKRVVTRAGFDADQYNQSLVANGPARMGPLGRLPRLAPPEFDQVMESELVLRGTVFTGPDRRPVAMALVDTGNSPQNMSPRPMTDATGRFEVRGVRRGPNLTLFVTPPQDSNLLMRAQRCDVPPGQTEAEVDVELKEGVFVDCHLFDQATGRGIEGGVRFVPLPGNRFADQPGYDNPIISYRPTDDDGHVRLKVGPGLGVLLAQKRITERGIEGQPDNTYRQASFSKDDSERVPITVNGERRTFTSYSGALVFLASHNAAKVIDLTIGADHAKFDLAFDPGKIVTIAIEDEQGRSVSDAWVAGVTESMQNTLRITESTCTVYALGADRPRRIRVLHPARHLAGSLVLTGDEPAPATVRLAATASIAGRALDPDGEPVADATVRIGYGDQTVSDLDRSVSMVQAPVKTDADGRFLVENVVPGERLTLSFVQGDSFFYLDGLTTKERQLDAGQKLELGDVALKQNR